VKVEAGACKQEKFAVRVNGSISGRILDSAGRPLTHSDKHPEPVELLPINGKGQPLSVYLQEDGQFRFTGVHEGKYFLAINLFSSSGDYPYPPTYYPGTVEKDRATIIEMGRAEQLSGYDLHVGPPRTVIELGVLVVGEDGMPLAKANVYNHETNQEMAISSSVTGTNGQATLTAFAGDKERLNAWWNCSKSQLNGETTIETDDYRAIPVRLVVRGKCQ
jgi:hypothetical protein